MVTFCFHVNWKWTPRKSREQTYRSLFCSEHFYLTLQRETHIKKNCACDFWHSNLMGTRCLESPKCFKRKPYWQKHWQPEIKGSETLCYIRRHLSPQLCINREQDMSIVCITMSFSEIAKKDNRVMEVTSKEQSQKHWIKMVREGISTLCNENLAMVLSLL